MSNRRIGFDTSLSSSGGASKPTANGNGNGNSRSARALPPHIPTPEAAEPTANVPTESHDDEEVTQTEVVAEPTQEEMDDTYTCFICAEPTTFWSTGVCGHKTCQ